MVAANSVHDVAPYRIVALRPSKTGTTVGRTNFRVNGRSVVPTSERLRGQWMPTKYVSSNQKVNTNVSKLRIHKAWTHTMHFPLFSTEIKLARTHTINECRGSNHCSISPGVSPSTKTAFTRPRCSNVATRLFSHKKMPAHLAVPSRKARISVSS